MKANNVDIRKVKKLIKMLEESELAEIEIHEGEESVRISRSSEHSKTTVHMPAVDLNSAKEVTTNNQNGKIVDDEGESKDADGHYIRSPMVGIFYTSPAPDKPPFIEHGAEVKLGDVVCIIEAMKIMNQIDSDINGVVTRILVENGDPVEYGQPLFLIREV